MSGDADTLESTGGPFDSGRTVISTDADFPSLDAVAVVLPALTATTSPLADTVAMLGAAVVHTTVRPTNVPPMESVVLAASCTVWLTVSVAVVGDTITRPTGTGNTVSCDAPLAPSLLAVIVAAPGALTVTIPVVVTVATALLLLLHAMLRPLNTAPFAEVVVAESVSD
jgi:hypothetical protein